MVVKEKIIEVLQLCYDPEIPIDLWSLGLIYSIDINDNEIVLKNLPKLPKGKHINGVEIVIKLASDNQN